jgi:hypothetical protein
MFVRWTALAGTSVSMLGALWLYGSYDMTLGGFQFFE